MTPRAAIRRLPSSRLGNGKLRQDDHERVDEEDDSDPRLGHARLVLREDRQELELRVARRDEENVQQHDPAEDVVADDVGVASRRERGALIGVDRLGHERQHADEDEEGRRVEEEEDREARRVPRRRDQPAGNATEPDPRFRETRWSANAAWRRCCGVNPARSADWLGQKPAFPIPATALARNACHGSVMNA